MEDATSPESTHDLLLALAGRVDDDMLAWGRELVAVGEDARAVELLTASLVAEHAVLPVPVRAALVAAGRAVRTGLDADTALPPAVPEDVSAHRFTATPTSAVEDVAAAVRALPPRQLRDCRVQLTWRLTPTGSAPGPLPQPVVLVEVEPGGRPGDVLAYQLAVALERAGARASVEVLTTGRPRSAYHEAALREARVIVTDGEPPAAGARDTDSLPTVEASVPFSGTWLPTSTPAQRPTPVAPLPSHVTVPGAGVAPAAAAAQEQPPAVPPRPAPQPQPLAAQAAASQPSESPAVASQQAASPAAASRPPASLSVAPLPTRVWPAPRADDQRSALPTRESSLLTGPIGTAPRDAAPADAPASAPAPAFDPAPHESAQHDPARHETARHESPTHEADARETGPNGTSPRGAGLFEPSSFETTPREATPRETTLRETTPDEPAATEQTAEVRATTPTPAPQPVRSLPESGGRRRAPIPASEGAEPAPRPLPRPVPSPGLPRRPTVTPISRAGLPSPVPLRRTGPSPVVRPLVPVGEPEDEQPDVRPEDAELTAEEPAPREPERGRQPALAETPAFATMRDPLNGPLDDQPLLEPLLEPTFSDEEPVDFGGLHPLADEPSTGAPRRSAEKSWVSDWASGDWAMSPRALADPGSGEAGRTGRDDDGDTGSRDTDEPVAEAPPVIGRRAARHRYADEPDEEPATPAEEPAEEPAPARPDPERAPAASARPAPDAAPADEPRVEEPPAEEPDLGLHPESLARLSEADRELLERLQAELVEGRRPRMSRRAGVAGAPTNGSSNGSPSPNGRNGHGSGSNGRVDPPDLAG